MTTLALRLYRKQKGWSQSETAVRLGVSQSYVSMLENVQRPMTPALARKAARIFDSSPTALPLSRLRLKVDMQELAEDLAALGYPGFAYLLGRRKKSNPADVLLTALAQENLEARLAEALPWLLLRYSDMDSHWLVQNAKLHDLQNRLGFVVGMARGVAQQKDAADSPRFHVLRNLESSLERCRLAHEDTLCQASLTQPELLWLRQNRSEDARHWNLLTDWRVETLRYVA